MSEPVIEVSDLTKVYRTPFQRRRVQAVRGASFRVERGQVFGFLGPNGAGKTTTIRILMGLIYATTGSAKLFGKEVPARSARARLGFLPEAPYFYDYLTVSELVDLAGRLFGMPRAARRKRTDELIELVGLQHARSTPLKKYSKGMLQRAGIAQALVNDPELVVLDEPMSGLDPMGRKEVRDIIVRLHDEGKTVCFSSHILADVEMICDHVAIIIDGKVRDSGALSQLIDAHANHVEVALRLADVSEDGIRMLAAEALASRLRGSELTVRLAPDTDLNAYVVRAASAGARLISVVPHHETLEELFIRRAGSVRTPDSEVSVAETSP